MAGVTVERTSATIELLELYSARLSSLRADMMAIHQEVENLASDFAISLDAARTAAEHALAAAELPAFEVDSDAATLASSDPEIGTEIEIFSEEANPLDLGGTIDTVQRGDDLTGIVGIDGTAAETLDGFGIRTYSDLARIDADEAVAIGTVLGDADRVSRECWVEQATLLTPSDAECGTPLAESADGSSPALTEAVDNDASGTGVTIPQTAATTADPMFEDIVIEQDPTTRQLIMAAASLAQAIAAQRESEQTAVAESAEILALPVPTATTAAPTEGRAEGESSVPTLASTGAEIIDIAAHRTAKQPAKRRLRTVAASLVMLLLTGVAIGTSGEQLGFDMSTLTNCGEALLLGDTTCVDLPASLL